MKTQTNLHEELRQRILSLPGVTERRNAGIHEDAFFVDRTMFMHIHGRGHCDIRLSDGKRGSRLGAGPGVDSDVTRAFYGHRAARYR